MTFAPVSAVVGVNDNLQDGRHILMWDFDEYPRMNVLSALAAIQEQEGLPPIYVYRTSPGDYYAARCFYAVDWWNCKRIIASTPGVDESYFRFGVYREHFTLRVGPKHGRYLELIDVLDSPVRSNCCEKDLKSWTIYETVSRPHKNGNAS
jgi:hypothetical protein